MKSNVAKRALILGCSGQDGVYLTECLGKKGYEIYALQRRQADRRVDPRKADILKRYHVNMITGDITDLVSIINAINIAQPDEIYNLAAQSFVGASWDIPIHTMEVTGLGAVNIYEAVRQTNPKIKIYQASSSELFGKVTEIPQNEDTIMRPRSPYGVAKLLAHSAAVNYRESYDMFISCGILFNHESMFRGQEFVTRKITLGVARIYHGIAKDLVLGNLEAKRDWAHAKDAVRAMQMMLQQDEPDDYVIATGETNSVRDFVAAAFAVVNIDPTEYIKQDERFMRPAEIPILLGDPSKAKDVLGWEPKIKFPELVERMVEADLDYVKSFEM